MGTSVIGTTILRLRQERGWSQQALARRFGRRLDTRVVIDPELIGGVRVVVGDEVLDTSVRARLEQMRTALAA